MYRYRVMAVDDEPEVLEILSIALREKYDVVTASNGLDALEKLDDFEPDLMVTDVMMPLMNGWEVITEVRKRPAYAHMPVIFLTALNSRKDIMAGYQAGADLYLTKPFDPLRVRKNLDVFIEKTPPPQRKRLKTWAELQERLKAPPKPIEELAPKQEETVEKTASGFPKFEITPRLFIVDDDEELLEVLRLNFRDDFEVFTAADGLDAVKRIPTYQPDIFIVDGMLPKMTGYQLCDTLRRSSAYIKSPIIFISAKADPKTRETMKRFNLVDYIAKPFEAEQVADVLKSILSQPEFKPRLKKMSAEELVLEEEVARDRKSEKEKIKNIVESKSTVSDFIKENE